MTVTLTFHGACATVTGSCFEVRNSQASVLIDCGMFQGTKTIKALNYGAFGFSPSRINAVILTHAHIDHCGLVTEIDQQRLPWPCVCHTRHCRSADVHLA